MKKRFLTFMLAGAVLTGGLVSCSSDDDSSSVNNTNAAEISSIAQSGTWRVTSFQDSDNNVTHHLEGYSFTFGPNSVLTAVKGEDTQTGSWYITDDDSDDDNSHDNPAFDDDFNIVFPTTNSYAFEEISEDWDIVEITATKISLIDVSGGDGDTDVLVFEKN